ncbi:DUF4178 domain-containing protein [uncultured Lacinutrix sp.]|uniref:DUF4178 domain-containing protein n=1 Tax=uncultured Lacinutrix sp. TaxID=574032 RepID=UPI0026330025|nr:DUF4178 domain-containing protein [uncultured Lacinutrix sp.]
MFGNSKEEFPLNKLKLDYTLKLFDTDWTIVEVGEYDWNMDNSSIEYTIQSLNKIAYIEVELIKGKYEVIYSENIDIEESFLIDAIQERTIYFEDNPYVLDETYSGNYKNPNTYTRRESLDSYMFYYKDSILTIEKWDDGSYEAFLGKEIKAKKIKNIKNN